MSAKAGRGRIIGLDRLRSGHLVMTDTSISEGDINPKQYGLNYFSMFYIYKTEIEDRGIDRPFDWLSGLCGFPVDLYQAA